MPRPSMTGSQILDSFMKKKILAIILIASFLPIFTSFSLAAFSAESTKGYILVQTEDNDKLWYVDPVDSKAYLISNKDDLIEFGLGLSEKDFYNFAYKMPKKYYGRIIIRTASRGQAYYVSPRNGRLFFLGTEDNFNRLVHNYGLAIRDSYLAKIPGSGIGDLNIGTETGTKVVRFDFKYQNKDYFLEETYNKDTYDVYNKTSKVLVYNTSNPPSNLRESFYSLFVKLKAGDGTLIKLANDLKKLAKDNGYEDDQLVEFVSTFVEYIPYDESKIENNVPYFMYETLYTNSGVCADKSFLLYSILKELGYGAAIFDYPDALHTAAAVACPKEESSHNSGYCFIETTNYFPIGVFPQAISKGQAAGSDSMSKVFDTSYLGRVEIYLKSSGKEYTGLAKTKEEIDYLTKQENSIESKKEALTAQVIILEDKQEALKLEKAKMDQYLSSGDNAAYNQELPAYNVLVADYNKLLEDYKSQQSTYNSMLEDYNNDVKDFYQQ